MFTFHTHQQSLCQLVSPKPLVENVVLPQTETKNKRIHPFSIKSIPLPELVERHSALLLFQTN